jgi:hypothetical protein
MITAGKFIENLRSVFGTVEMSEAFPYVYLEVHIEKLQPIFAQYERVLIFHAHSHAPTVEPWTQALNS